MYASAQYINIISTNWKLKNTI